MPTRDPGKFDFMTPWAPSEKSKSLGFGGSMVARLKLKGIDGRAHQEWSLRLNLTQHGKTYQVNEMFGPGIVGCRIVVLFSALSLLVHRRTRVKRALQISGTSVFTH